MLYEREILGCGVKAEEISEGGGTLVTVKGKVEYVIDKQAVGNYLAKAKFDGSDTEIPGMGNFVADYCCLNIACLAAFDFMSQRNSCHDSVTFSTKYGIVRTERKSGKSAIILPKCKELLTKRTINLYNCTIFCDIMASECGNILLFKCNDCSHFIPSALRISFAAFAESSPVASVAFSVNDNEACADFAALCPCDDHVLHLVALTVACKEEDNFRKTPADSSAIFGIRVCHKDLLFSYTNDCVAFFA